jgi:hypothetical protein
VLRRDAAVVDMQIGAVDEDHLVPIAAWFGHSGSFEIDAFGDRQSIEIAA